MKVFGITETWQVIIRARMIATFIGIIAGRYHDFSFSLTLVVSLFFFYFSIFRQVQKSRNYFLKKFCFFFAVCQSNLNLWKNQLVEVVVVGGSSACNHFKMRLAQIHTSTNRNRKKEKKIFQFIYTYTHTRVDIVNYTEKVRLSVCLCFVCVDSAYICILQ